MKLVAKTFHGLEPVLAKELEEMGARDIKILKRAVSFESNKELLYKSNLCLRTAIRILQPLTTFTARDEQQLYEKVKAFNWAPYLRNDQTLAIDAVVFSKYFQHSKYVALKTKDAICDQFRESTGKRPSVDVERPNLLINVHVAEDKFTLSMDSSGEPLNRRGYRGGEHPAPINEVLAAGMILLSGWDGVRPFHDPMCGSGTIVMEATMFAANMAPNINRNEFGFSRWNNFDPELWKNVLEEVKSKVKRPECRITGSDISKKSIDIARQSALDFSLKQYIDFQVSPFSETHPIGKGGVLMMNPPYDERLKTKDIVVLYEGVGTKLKHEYTGWEAWIISSNLEALKLVGLKPSEKHTLFNGALKCGFHKFGLYEGSKKRVNRSLQKIRESRGE
ncbi:THUMP domain-containing class I SAM-dependent RNA methyltransferase [Alkalitalea saponilacus]|uniref:Putative N6-adenine-specific DNA methylase n=1 Tax=Alkalitalea saponilacus TaxID=889453 RepID=A0A1T5D2Z1_9BACT|nr:THUMP domain-containing protein [Alkalitalea saponilacus]ASB50558.1 RNA methyltransferase [Alkalitalea saponilacus]SKB66118.1 putative N6-adenine-specific DNA methylase [Alkalitalea saponilacus]